MTTLTESNPGPETKSLYLQAGEIEFDAILRLDGIDAMVSVLHLAFQGPEGDTPTHDTIHAYCGVIGREVEAIKKDVQRITEMIKERG